MRPQRQSVSVTTAADGSATAYSDIVNGRLLQIHYTADGTAPYDNTVDFTITAEATGQSLLAKSNVSASFAAAPRQKVVDETGADALFAAGGTNMREPIVLAGDRVKIVLAQGGNTKTGRFDIVVG